MSRRAPAEAAAPMIEVLVVDDHHGFRRVLCAVLDAEADMCVVGEAVDGDEAVAKALELVPNVVLLDVEMPGAGGIDAARALKEVLPTAKVIMLTTSDDEEDLYRALRAGASSYLLKHTALADLPASIRVAATGHSVLSPSMAAKLVAEFARPAQEPEPCLSDRETEIPCWAEASGPAPAESLFRTGATVGPLLELVTLRGSAPN